MWKTAVAFIVLSLSTACAAHRSPALDPGAPARAAQPVPPGVAQGEQSLATYIEKVNALSLQARPVARTDATPMEASDGELKAALAALAVAATPERERAVADAYRRAGVLDLAMDHYARAVRLDARDADAYDAMARIWRDWGFPQLGLGDAYRAVYYAPRSPVPSNTLGTLLQSLGQTQQARQYFQRAVRIDPGAFFALNNLCYSLRTDNRPREAADACEKALVIAPDLVQARKNLAVVRADQDGVEAPAHSTSAGDRSLRGDGLPPRPDPAGAFHDR